MADRTWKRIERCIAQRLGGERVPVSGRQRGDNPDIRHPLLSLEVKHRKLLPDWLHEAMGQAVASQRNGQIPTVVLHQNRQQISDSFVVIRLSDFVEWFDPKGDANAGR